MNIISIFETHQAPLKIYIYIFKLWYINTKDYVKQTLFLLLDHSGARQKYIYFTETNALRPKIFFLPNVMLCKIMELNLVTFFKRDTTDCPVGKGGAPWGGVLPYMAYTGMCRWTAYGFRPLCPKQGT